MYDAHAAGPGSVSFRVGYAGTATAVVLVLGAVGHVSHTSSLIAVPSYALPLLVSTAPTAVSPVFFGFRVDYPATASQYIGVAFALQPGGVAILGYGTLFPSAGGGGAGGGGAGGGGAAGTPEPAAAGLALLALGAAGVLRHKRREQVA